MKKDSEKILIISYSFPPSAGIGGRRWAKIAKYWYQKGNDVEVIASYNSNNISGSWNKDIEALLKDNRITYTRSYYPDIIRSRQISSFINRIKYRLALIFVKLFSKGNCYDRSIFWSYKVKRIVKKKIKIGYTKIVASGAPFYYLKDIVKLKKQFPQIEVWIDLRDPWTWGSGYGMSSLNSKRLKIEKSFEDYVIQHADLVTVPIEKMLNHINTLYQGTNKRKVLSHFYDPDDLPQVELFSNNDKIELIYAGTIYAGTQSYIQLIADHLLYLKKSGKDVKWNLYVPEPENVTSFLPPSKYNEVISVNAYVPADKVMELIAKSDLYIAVYPARFKDHLSTKFPELWALNTPLIYIGEEGEISQFIIENNMGVVLSFDKIKQEFGKVLLKQNQKQNNNLNTYSLEKIVGDSFSQNLN